MESLSGQTCVGGMDVGGRDRGGPIPCKANPKSRNLTRTSNPNPNPNPKSRNLTMTSNPKSRNLTMTSNPKSRNLTMTSNPKSRNLTMTSNPKSRNLTMTSNPKSRNLTMTSIPKSRNVTMTSSPKVQDDNRGKKGSHPAPRHLKHPILTGSRHQITGFENDFPRLPRPQFETDTVEENMTSFSVTATIHSHADSVCRTSDRVSDESHLSQLPRTQSVTEVNQEYAPHCEPNTGIDLRPAVCTRVDEDANQEDCPQIRESTYGQQCARVWTRM